MLRTVPQGPPLARPRARSLHWRDPAMPELPDVTVYLEALAARIGGARLERIRLANPFVLRSVDPPPAEVGGSRGDRRPAPGQAHRDRARGRALRGRPPDDRGPAALEGRRREAARQDRAGRVRLLDRHAHPHRGGIEAPRRPPPGSRRGRARRPRSGRPRALGPPTRPPSGPRSPARPTRSSGR